LDQRGQRCTAEDHAFGRTRNCILAPAVTHKRLAFMDKLFGHGDLDFIFYKMEDKLLSNIVEG
jgi:hypothetical protein